MAFRLHGLTGTWTLPLGDSVIGRGRDCAVRIADPRLSRAHARINVEAGSAVIHDLGSTNGVLVNGDRINGSRRLQHGDAVVCGPVLLHVVETPAAEPAQVESDAPVGLGSGMSRTDAMEPIETAQQVRSYAARSRSTPPRNVAVAEPPNSTARASDPVSDRLTPGEQQRPPTSALSAHELPVRRVDSAIAATLAASGLQPAEASDGTSALDSLAEPRGKPGKNQPAQHQTTHLMPTDLAPRGSAALTAKSEREAPDLRRRRLLAGALDVLVIALVADGIGALLAATGYALAVAQAGARMSDGLPVLGAGGGATWLAVLGSLVQPGGLARAGDLVPALARSDQGGNGAFLLFFAGATAGMLVWTLAHLLLAVAATVLHGAPAWHRRYGLVVVRMRNGHHLGWGRALLRWLLLGLLLPMAPITAALGRRGLHDVLSGCRIHDRGA